MTVAIAILLGLSAMAELFGTITVWKNCSSGAQLAEVMLAGVDADLKLREEMMVQQSAAYLVKMNDPVFLAMTGNDAAEKLLDLRSQVGHHLGRNRWVSAGLVAYVVGAVLGVAAGYLALIR